MSEDLWANRCGSCGAFGRLHQDAELGMVGECALEVFPPPVRPGSTCSRYRPKGALQAAPRPRVAGEPKRRRAASSSSGGSAEGRRSQDQPLPAVRRALPQEIDIDMDIDEFREVLREVIAHELGVGDPELGARWQGGELLLKPGDSDTQSKSVPIESFFHKIVMVRDKLRVLEAKLNAHSGLSDEEKVQLQSYVTACYGSLTTFNVLFAQREDSFSRKG